MIDTHLTTSEYAALYQQSLRDPTAFWQQQAQHFVSWFAPWQQVMQGDFNHLPIEWFVGALLNVSYNCIDRHLATRAKQLAIIWEGDELLQQRTLTYAQLYQAVCRCSNLLKHYGISKGDRVAIYLPMIPEAIIAMLACTRIGAIHSVVFAGFSAASLQARIQDAGCKVVITADAAVRGGNYIPLKHYTDSAVANCPSVQQVIVVKHTRQAIQWQPPRDVWFHDAMSAVDASCEPTPMEATAPLFILYTSGSTGKPKGILHTTAGYLVYVATTFAYIFDYQEGDIHWCTADIGWITGHSYVVYGPLVNGATIVMFEGVPHYPDYSRFWHIIDKYQVTSFYTAPTALRALRREGDEFVKTSKRCSLKLLGSVGEPINPEVWHWYYQVVGNSRCPIVDTWWQTETGGILISPFPATAPLKPGAAMLPFFGIEPQVVDDMGNPVAAGVKGHLIIKQPWPGLMNTIYGDNPRFVQNYFTLVAGAYLTGDMAICDTDGDYWILGRDDDVIKISGHRLGTGELESALLTHAAVAEAAVVGIPHDIKGHTIYAYIVLKTAIVPDEPLKQQVIAHVRDKIGSIATIATIQWCQALPKTRSGKVMRRILRQIACHELDKIGDTSTLADPTIIENLVNNVC